MAKLRDGKKIFTVLKKDLLRKEKICCSMHKMYKVFMGECTWAIFLNLKYIQKILNTKILILIKILNIIH